MSTPLRGIEILHCQTGGVTSRSDGGVKISFVTPELRPSEAGALIQLHGKNVCVSIVPEDAPPEEIVKVDTERGGKSPSQRLHAVLFLNWQRAGSQGIFSHFYERKMEQIIDEWKAKLNAEA